MSDGWIALTFLIVITIIITTLIKIMDFRWERNLRKKLIELDDCPFKFYLDSYYLIFDLIEVKLYSRYKFGIQKSGVYGVSEIILDGINGSYGGEIPLEFGQSIYPVISRIKEFNEWSATKSFPVLWDANFKFTWDHMIKNLNNLDYLEQKYDKRKKK